jgi:signal transduction histidine kinase
MKLNLSAKFLLPVVAILILMAILLSFLVEDILRQSMLNRAATFVADFVELQATTTLPDSSVFNNLNSENQNLFENLQREVKTHEVVRIKIWNSDKTVVYSDDKNLIGKTFKDNDELDDAISGRIKTEISTPSKNENIDEKDLGQLLEIYVPVYFEHSDKPVGIIETYYKLDNLNNEIRQVQTSVILLILSAFFMLTALVWLLIHILITNPLRKIEYATTEIEKGNFDSKVKINSSDEIGNLAASFNKMSDGLKRLQELRNEFVFLGAHELRAPVTAIKGYVSLILDAKDISLPENVNKYLKTIKMLNDHLNELVGNILEIARSDAGRIEIKVVPVDITNIIKNILMELQPLASDKKITLNYPAPSGPLEIMADEGKLKEVLMNLISNAIKYGKDNGYVNVNHQIKESSIITSVTNTGPGIPKTEQIHIFNKFFRAANARSSDIQGTGLGLFITKEIVEKMKGKLWFVSEENKETTFSFELPTAKQI